MRWQLDRRNMIKPIPFQLFLAGIKGSGQFQTLVFEKYYNESNQYSV